MLMNITSCTLYLNGTSIPNLSVYHTPQNSAAGLCVVVYYSETGQVEDATP